LVVEELVMNVASYGSDDPAKPPDIEITVDSEPGALRLDIKDTGRPFDPRDAPDPDIHASIKDRPVGGLGHYLVEEMTDEMVYRREDGKNHITLTIYRT
ncbi:MAG: ATP-binding protein, partial [Chloroflexota bacterium]|nr:ATP-binding protein [Chloroflexota bacterium]